MSDLDKVLGALKAPSPRADLAARILAQAEATPQTIPAANDRKFSWKPLMAIAACLVAVAFAGFYTLSPSDISEDEAWALTADNTGFSDLYDWVYAEESETEGS